MFEILALAAAAGAGYFGLRGARSFVRRRLRFIGAVRRPAAALIAGAAAAVVALPVVGLLPIVGAGTAIVFGIGVGAGTRLAARDIDRGEPGLFPYVD